MAQRGVHLGELVPGEEAQVTGVPIQTAFQQCQLGPQLPQQPQQQQQMYQQQHAMVLPSYCHGGGACVWVPVQSISGMAQCRQGQAPVAQQPQVLQWGQCGVQQPTPQRPKRRLTLDAAEAVYIMYDLYVPHNVLRLWHELQDLEGVHNKCRTEENRLQQLEDQLRMMERMEDELVRYAEDVLDWQQKSGCKEGFAQQWNEAWQKQQKQGQAAQMEQQTGATEMRYEGGDCKRGPTHTSSQRPPPRGTQRPPPVTQCSRPRMPTIGEDGHARSQAALGLQAAGAVSGTPVPAPADLQSPHGSATDTMKTHLQALRNEKPATVFIARRINKLGFNSAEQLQSYFSKYGEVKSVFVSHSRVKSMRPGTYWRLRAASLGFVVMSSANDAVRILEDGPEHNVSEVRVTVHEFHQHKAESSCAEEGYEDADETAHVQMGVMENSHRRFSFGTVGSIPLPNFLEQDLYGAQLETYEE